MLTHRQSLREVWRPNSEEHSHCLHICLGHLRKKLEADPARPAYFLTETGVRDRFVAQPLKRRPGAPEASPPGQ